MALLERQVGQVIGEATELLSNAGIAKVQQDVQAQRLERRKMTLPTRVVKLDANRILLVLRQTEHLEVVVAHKVLGFTATHSVVHGTRLL